MHSLEGLSVERPRTLDGATELLAEGGAALAGGTDLLIRLRQGAAKPRRLVYLGRIPELTSIEAGANSAEVGAAVTHAQLLRSPLAKQLPIIAKALSTIGGPAIRAMGTLGGNVANASPAGDGLIPLYLLDARVQTYGPDGARTISVHDFVTGPGTVELLPGELIRSILIRIPSGDPLSYFRKVGRRKALVIAVASLGALIWVNGGSITEARLALGSVAPTVLRPGPIEQELIGSLLDPQALEGAVQRLSELTQPIDDLRAPADYRRRVAGSLLVDMAESVASRR